MCIYKLIVYQFYVYAIAIKYIFYIVLCNSKRWPYIRNCNCFVDVSPSLFLSLSLSFPSLSFCPTFEYIISVCFPLYFFLSITKPLFLPNVQQISTYTLYILYILYMNVSYALKFDLNLLDLFCFLGSGSRAKCEKIHTNFVYYTFLYMHVGVVCIVMYIYVCISVYIGM